MSDVYDLGGVIVDAVTGEILSSDGDPIERIIAAGIEAKQQIKQWEAYHGAMKAAASGMLTADRPKVETVKGIAKRITSNRRRATPELLPALARDFELTSDQVTRIYETAKELDPNGIDALVSDRTIPGEVADMLITISRVSYVQFDALRKVAPVAVEAGE